MPGGLPLYKNGVLVGGIGVFFPGTTGYATEENSKLNTPLLYDPHKLDLSDVAEYMGFVAAGGSVSAGYPLNGPVNGATALPDFTEPFGRIDLAGITLDLFGPHGLEGIKNLLNFGATLGVGSPGDGTNYEVDPGGDTLLAGQPVPSGWLVLPHAGTGLTAADVEAIVAQGIAEANQTRADPGSLEQHRPDGLCRERRERQHPRTLPHARRHLFLDPGCGRQGAECGLLR